MANEIKALAADHNRKWKMLEELHADPFFSQYIVVKPASRATSSASGNTHVERTATVQTMPMKPRKAANPKGYMIRGVELAVAKLPNEFTPGDIEKVLKVTPNFSLGAKHVNIAINDALGHLKKRGTVDRTKRKRGFQRIWRKTQQSSAVESRTA